MKRALCALICTVLAASALSAQPKTRRVYMNVVGADGAPVTDLATDDVQVREGGVSQKITRLGLSNHPMRIALLVDTSAGSLFQLVDLRTALTAFFDAVPAPHEVLLVTTGSQVRVRVQPTSDQKKLKDSAQSLFTDTGGGTGTLLYDALDEVDGRFMKKAVDRLPVFVVVTGDGAETSQRLDERAVDQFTQSLQSRDVPVHAVVLSRGAAQTPASLALHLTGSTRGHSDVIGSSLQLTDKLKALGAAIVENERKMSTWYEVEFVSTSTDAQPLIEVGLAARPGVRTQVAATRRVP